MTARIFFKLILAVFCLLAVAMTSADVMASRIAETTYVHTLSRELTEKCRMLAHLSGGDFARMDQRTLSSLESAAGARLTVIAHDGRVLLDSDNNPEKMENHRNRPELKEALAGREGSSTRLSPTMGVKFLYVAVPVPVGALRLAVPLSEIEHQVSAIRRQMLTSTLLAFLPAVVLAGIFARQLSGKLAKILDFAGQLAKGNFRARLEQAGRGEIGHLTLKLNETGEKLQETFEHLEREQAELKKLEVIRKDFVINVSHELRTPLASIQGYAETLMDGAVDDPEINLRFLAIIRQNAARLTSLTADLMTLSRSEMGNHELHFASYYVNSLLQQAVDSVRPIADKKAIGFQLVPEPENSEVFCDAEAVHQILGNLLDNAIKYTPERGTVTVGARELSKSEGKPDSVEIWVRDTGIGIPADELPRLFERFYRVDKARSRELGGTGLGLAIVKHLVRSLGGEVRVESVVNEGTAFFFTLPVEDLGLADKIEVHPRLTVL
jgi:two-component system phosphate regulon sensor histidine kinase PhoR